MIQIQLTRTIKILMGVCLAAFVLQQGLDRFAGTHLQSGLGLVPQQVVGTFAIWQLVTYSFLHADVAHLALNLMMLAFIAGDVERVWGTRRFLQFYFTCVVGAGAAFLLLVIPFGASPSTVLVGASGGIYGLLLSYGYLFGERNLLFMMVFPMKAKVFIWVLAGLEFLTTVFGQGSSLSGVAHLGGMLTGFLYFQGRAYWVARQAVRQAERSVRGGASKRAGHLRLVVDKDTQGKSNKSDDSPNKPTWH